jgi:simple sugar transport system substrate-binding protein
MLKKTPGVTIVEEERVPESDDVSKTMESMIRLDGASLLFPTSFGYFDPYMLKTAAKYKSVQFRHCGGLWQKDKHPMNTGSYFGYIGMCQYLNGIAAAHATKTKKIGFIAAKPIPQVLININSFTLGARSVDPAITTSVIFTGEWSMPVKEAEASNSLIDQGIDVMTCHVDSPKVVMETAERRGIFACGYHANQSKLAPKGYLTGAEWNWITVYQQFIADAQAGKPIPNFTRGGLAEGFVKMSPFGPGLPEAGRAQVTAVKDEMMKGGFSVFKGPLKDNKGNPVIPVGTAYPETAIELESLSYLVEGVNGALA